MTPRQQDKCCRAILRVGSGRGFVTEVDDPRRGRQRYIVTAAHCLPYFPPAISWSDLAERTYANLLAPLGENPIVWAECLFADPIRDIAVLGRPDDQELGERAEAFEELVGGLEALSIGDIPRDEKKRTLRARRKQQSMLGTSVTVRAEDGSLRRLLPTSRKGKGLSLAALRKDEPYETTVWLMDLDNQWMRCAAAAVLGGGLWIAIKDGKGLVGGMSGSPIVLRNGRVVGVFSISMNSARTEGGPQAWLTQSLPGWMLS